MSAEEQQMEFHAGPTILHRAPGRAAAQDVSDAHAVGFDHEDLARGLSQVNGHLQYQVNPEGSGPSIFVIGHQLKEKLPWIGGARHHHPGQQIGRAHV